MSIESITLRRSKRGVPHTLYVYKGRTYSVCYFGQGKMYRIFEQFRGSFDQRKVADVKLELGEEKDLINIFENLSKEKKYEI